MVIPVHRSSYRLLKTESQKPPKKNKVPAGLQLAARAPVKAIEQSGESPDQSIVTALQPKVTAFSKERVGGNWRRKDSL